MSCCAFVVGSGSDENEDEGRVVVVSDRDVDDGFDDETGRDDDGVGLSNELEPVLLA